MRVTDSYRFAVYENNLSLLKAKMDRSTTQVSSGRKVLVPSDDPGAFSKNIGITAQQSQNTQFKTNLNSLQTAGKYYESAVNNIGDVLTVVQQLAVQDASDTVDQNARNTGADQIDDIIKQLVTVGNTKLGNTYIFGGKASNVAPYTLDTATNTVTFNGTKDVTRVSVDSATTIEGGISGNRIFTGNVNGSTVDIFATLKKLSADLRGNDTTALRADLTDITNSVDLTANNLAYIGTYTKNIDSLLATNATAGTSLTEVSSSLMDVDIAQAISDYSTISTAYQAALMTMSKVMSLNILNYMPAG